jgi:aspartyl-tRNA(Asn)/glutamyl-tRNA(Gln) amidotransferase subunit B
MSGPAYEPVIGLEIHVQLATRTKLFCGDSAGFGAEPNTRVCPVCLGLPGVLPVLNSAAVELATRASLGLGCTVNSVSLFARKHYFYPDLPKGYQITQYQQPLAEAGGLDVPGEAGAGGRVRVRRVHLEEDAGKLVHDRFPGWTASDLNRAGVPLIEIVTEPDIHSPGHARSFLVRLKQVLEYLEVSDCDMEKGSLRVDANVSIRPSGSSALGTKTELKNMNSFSAVERGLSFEIERQASLLAEGGVVVQQTLLWDPDAAQARPMRSKEESHDYRYLTEPDLLPLVLDPETVEHLRQGLPEMPAPRATRFRQSYGLPEYDAEVLTAARPVADYFEAVAIASGDAKAASNWVMTDVLAWLNDRKTEIGAYPVSPSRLASLIGLVSDATLSHATARVVLERMIETGDEPAAIVAAEGLVQVRDEARVAAWVGAVVGEFAHEAARFRAGEDRLFGFLMGQVMRKSGGKADPRLAADLLRDRLSG